MEPVRSLEEVEEEFEPPAERGMAGVDRPSPEAALSGIAHLLATEEAPERVFGAIAEGLSELVAFDALSVYEADPPLRVVRPVFVRDAYAAAILRAGPRPYGVGIIGSVAESEAALLVNDAHLDSRALQVPGTPPEPESLMALPLLVRDDLRGVLLIHRSGLDHHFAGEEFALAIRFAEMAALAIENAQIRARLQAAMVTDALTGLYNHRYFHERLAGEMRRANRRRMPVGLLIFDIDDFRRLNDTYGHAVGDDVLKGVATVAREACRAHDVICRIGGDEFAVIMPGSTLGQAVSLADRVRGAVSSSSFALLDQVHISVGATEGPLHAASARELTTCGQLALLQAKTSGRNRVAAFETPVADLDGQASFAGFAPLGHAANGKPNGRGIHRGASGAADALHPNGTGPDGSRGRRANRLQTQPRSVAQLRMLHSLSAKLSRLSDVAKIGEVITAELRTLVDYHNCRVYTLDDGGETLVPVAFRGDLLEYSGETFAGLICAMGEGITGMVAMTGESYYTANADQDPQAVTIPGTPRIDESMLAVPLKYDDRVLGVIVLSKLGLDQFDDEDRRLLEVLASTTAVAMENARLFQVEREAAATSRALLELSQALTKVGDTERVLDEALSSIPTMIRSGEVGGWIRDSRTGDLRLIRHQGFDRKYDLQLRSHVVPAGIAGPLLLAAEEPFILPRDLVETVPEEVRLMEEAREVLIAPMRWEPDGLGAFVIAAPEAARRFSQLDLDLARGIADITSLALGNARRYDDLERAYVSTVEALANALEAQDAYTEAHCRALAELAVTVGRDMGLSVPRLKRLELGAVFHDIGKIGVPSEIIRKPGPLTAAERRVMEQHTVIGAQILEPVPFLQPVIPIVRSSHERWDGGGYPEGLAGEDIPLESRIVFVCDAFHAMTPDRPYRAALPEREGIRRLKLASGTQFDPRVVLAFVKAYEHGRIRIHSPR